MVDFIAVKCFHCSTFQVNQKTKANKFSCKLCNTKQSVKKVYAISNKAADIRQFVQQYNMNQGEIYENMDLQCGVAADPSDLTTGMEPEIAPVCQGVGKWDKFLPHDEEESGYNQIASPDDNNNGSFSSHRVFQPPTNPIVNEKNVDITFDSGDGRRRGRKMRTERAKPSNQPYSRNRSKVAKSTVPAGSELGASFAPPIIAAATAAAGTPLNHSSTISPPQPDLQLHNSTHVAQPRSASLPTTSAQPTATTRHPSSTHTPSLTKKQSVNPSSSWAKWVEPEEEDDEDEDSEEGDVCLVLPDAAE